MTKDDTRIGWHFVYESYACEPFDRYDGMMYHFAELIRGECENEYSYEYESGLQRLILSSCCTDIR